MSDYEINEKDIDSVIRYLKIHDPDNATPEKAIALLEEMQAGIHEIGHENPDLLFELQKELDKDKPAGKTS
jgi:hypothetical protein